MTEQQHDEALSLHSFLVLLRRRIWLVLACAIVVPASVLAFSLAQQKQYSASASLLFRDPAFDQKLFSGAQVQPSVNRDRDAATNLRLASLGVVGQLTAKKLDDGLTGGDVSSKVSVTSVGKSDVVSITATDSKPARAARIANTFGEQYIAFRRNADRSKIREAKHLIDREFRGLPDALKTSTRGQQLQRRSEQLDVLSSLQTGNAELVQRASVPSTPSSPKPVRNAAIGFVLGLVLGVLLAVLFDRLDRRLRDPKEVEEIMDRPILGAIPQSRTLARIGPTSRSLPANEQEAFRMLRANLRYFNVDRDVQSVLVTSAAPGDGKSTVSWNLASAAAGAGAKVLLIEADLRHPSLAAAKELRPVPGLSNVLSGAARLEEVAQSVEVPQRQNGTSAGHSMDVVVAGPLPPNPTDLIESSQMEEVIRSAEERYELVVIDTPPTSVVSDAIPLVTRVSGVIVVSRLGKSTREAVVHLRNQLRNLDAPTLGVVVNALGTQAAGYGYGYGHAYGAVADEKPDAARAWGPFRRKPSEPAPQSPPPGAGDGAPQSQANGGRIASSAPPAPARSGPQSDFSTAGGSQVVSARPVEARPPAASAPAPAAKPARPRSGLVPRATAMARRVLKNRSR